MSEAVGIGSNGSAFALGSRSAFARICDAGELGREAMEFAQFYSGYARA